MAYQKLFRTKYTDLLLDQVNNGLNLERFYESHFKYDESQTLSVPSILSPDGLKYKLRTDDNYSSAVALYEAFSTLSPLQAADSRLWVYLAIADLYSYVHNKWTLQLPAIDDSERLEKMKSNVRIHWFGLQKDSKIFSPMRHALANLWWSVYISIDHKASNDQDVYKYTKLLFKNETFRTRTATGFLGRNREALYGILDFMQQCPELFGHEKENALIETTKFLNCLGGHVQISFMDRHFFLTQLLENKDKIASNIIEKLSNKKNMKGYSKEDESLNILTANEPQFTDYLDTRNMASSMIKKSNF